MISMLSFQVLLLHRVNAQAQAYEYMAAYVEAAILVCNHHHHHHHHHHQHHHHFLLHPPIHLFNPPTYPSPSSSTHQVGRLENAIGWYHSHPGYGCWLSGIDVNTQMLNQQFQEPFVAIVVGGGVKRWWNEGKKGVEWG